MTTPTLKYILNPTSDVHIRVRLEKGTEDLSYYDNAIIFISDTESNSETGTTGMSKKVDLSSAGGMVNVDFKFSTAPSSGTSYSISGIAYRTDGVAEGLETLYGVEYVPSPTYGSHYSTSLSSYTDADGGYLKVFINYTGKPAELPFHHDASGARKITHFSINVVKHSTDNITVFSKRIVADSDSLTHIIDSNGTKYVYDVPNGENGLSLANADWCEVSLYAENVGGQTIDVTTETITIDNKPGALNIVSLERHQIQKFGTDFGDYTLKPAATLKVNYQHMDVPNISGNLTGIKLVVERYNSEETLTGTFTDVISITNLNTVLSGSTSKSETQSIVLKGGHKPNNGSTLFPSEFFKKNHHYLFKVRAQNTSGESNTTNYSTSTNSEEKFYTNGSLKKVHLLSDDSNSSTQTIFDASSKNWRSSRAVVSFKTFILMELGHKDSVTADDILNNIDSTFTFGESESGSGSVNAIPKVTQTTVTMGSDTGYLVEYTTNEIVSTVNNIKLNLIFNGNKANGEHGDLYVISTITDPNGGSSEGAIGDLYTGTQVVPSAEIVANVTGVGARDDFQLTRPYFTKKNTYSISLSSTRTTNNINFTTAISSTDDDDDDDDTISASSLKLNLYVKSGDNWVPDTYDPNVNFGKEISPVPTDGNDTSGYFTLSNSSHHSGKLFKIQLMGEFDKDPETTDYVELDFLENYIFYVPESFQISSPTPGTVLFNGNGYVIDEIWWLQNNADSTVTVQKIASKGVLLPGTPGYATGDVNNTTSLSSTEFTYKPGSTYASGDRAMFIFTTSQVPYPGPGTYTQQYAGAVPNPVRIHNPISV